MEVLSSKLRYLKIGVGVCIIVALFFSYQLPFGMYQTVFKEFFLGLALFLMILIMNHKAESGKRMLNLLLSLSIVVLMILYFFEKP